MRPFSEFHAHVDDSTAARADVARWRSSATWAYLLLRPGMEFVRQRSNFILGWQAAASAGGSLGGGVSAGAVGRAGRPPLGSWMILPALTTPATQTVLPSNDALYGAAHVELDRVGPVVLTVPANVDDRYYSVTVMDAHFNNVAHIGPQWTGNDAGSFALLPPGWHGDLPEAVRPIACPTVSVALFNRMLVQYADGDIDTVRAWQAGLRISPLVSWPDVDATPPDVPIDDLVHPEINALTDASEYMRIGVEHLRRNPMVMEADWMSKLATGLVSRDGGASQTGTALEAGAHDATLMIDSTLATWPRINGWMMPDPELGLPNPDVLRSAAFQQFQIGSNDVAEAAYYFADDDVEGVPLDGSGGRVYELAFRRQDLPTVAPSGYWSLTMYGEDSLLVANPIDRYATRVTRPGTVRAEDGGVTFTLSAVRPPGVPEPNWLPAPAGRFRLGIRVYYPDVEAVRRGWAPPAVRETAETSL